MILVNWGLNEPPIIRRLDAMGYKTFKSVEWDLNLIGIRNPNRRPGIFDDLFVVVYKNGFDWIEERYKCTTEAGLDQHLAPSNPLGVAILKPGQYRGVWSLDMHNSKYEALCQRNGKVTVYRDNNRDAKSDYTNEQSGYFGINIHRAHSSKIVQSTNVYSAGCQVIQNPADFSRLMGLCHLQIGAGYDKFSYTLIEGTAVEFEE